MLAIAGAALFAIDALSLAPPSDKALFLPTAQNDQLFSVVGLPEAPTPKPALTSEPAPVFALPSEPSIAARPARERYPVGTKSVTLLVENHTAGDLLYSHWFAYFTVVEGGQIPLTPREGTMENPDTPDPSLILKAGESMTLDVPIDIFDAPLTPDAYRVAQLACFADADGNALACTEITADFTIE